MANVSWTESFLSGSLTISPNKVSYQLKNRHGKLLKPSFEASCNEIKEWKEDKLNVMNLFAPAYSMPVWAFHIRLKDGKNHDFSSSSQIEMENALQAVTKACSPST